MKLRITLLPAVAAGLASSGLGLASSELSTKQLVLVSLALLLVVVAAASKRPKQVFLFAWILSLTYNRQYFGVFDALFGDNGSQGLYWIPADPLFLVLLGLWAGERVRQKRPGSPQGPSLLPHVLPFAGACLASALAAERMDWGIFEMARIVRLLLVLAYVGFNLGPAEWRVCVAAFGCTVGLQSSLALLQVTLNVGSAFTALFGSALEESGTPTRGAGTMAHPNVLGPYLLFLVPVFAALALTSRDGLGRVAAAATAALGLIGLACTLSRLPSVVGLAEVVATILILTAVGEVRASRAIGLLIVGSLALLVVGAPFAPRIRDRFLSDFKESLELRARYNRAAIRMAEESPFLGVGLNGFRTQLGRFIPEFEEMIEEGDEKRLEASVRVTAPVHNLYLLVLSETGIFGLATLLLFLGAVLVRGARSVLANDGARRGVCAGLLVGLLGQLAQQTADFSLWTDPLLYTFALIAGMLSTAGGIRRVVTA